MKRALTLMIMILMLSSYSKGWEAPGSAANGFGADKSAFAKKDVRHDTNVWVMKLAPGASPEAIATRMGMTYVSSVAGGQYHAFRDGTGTRVSVANIEHHIRQDDKIVWSERQVAKQQFRRLVVPSMSSSDVNARYNEIISKVASKIKDRRSRGRKRRRVIRDQLVGLPDPDVGKMSPTAKRAFSISRRSVSQAVQERLDDLRFEFGPEYAEFVKTKEHQHAQARNINNRPGAHVPQPGGHSMNFGVPMQRGTNDFAPPDPLYDRQWHIPFVRAPDTWNRHVSYRGNGAIVMIVDDGVQHTHPDLNGRYDQQMSFSYNDNGEDPMPYHGDTHGTSAAGVAVASSNNVCGVGICPECKLGGIKLIGGPSSDWMEAEALGYMNGMAAVYSNSWGPADDGLTFGAPGRVTTAALQHGATHGYGGLGSVFVWAGGNGAQNADNGNYDGYANNRHTIAVGAIDHTLRKSYYSEECACLMVSAPSSGTQGYGITTTTVTGSGSTGCTDHFGGTSSAAPVVAGAIGLLRGKFPHLSRRDITALLAESASQVEPGDSDWTPRNARGIAHNHKYGWGMLDMYDLTRRAILWERVPDERSCSSGMATFNVALGEGKASGTWHWSTDIALSNGCYNTPGAKIDYVEYVELYLSVSHRSRGDLAVTLTDPQGVKSILHTPHPDHSPFPAGGWTYGSARHWGQTMSGIWKIKVADEIANGMTGTVNSLQLIIYGHVAPIPPTPVSFNRHHEDEEGKKRK